MEPHSTRLCSLTVHGGCQNPQHYREVNAKSGLNVESADGGGDDYLGPENYIIWVRRQRYRMNQRLLGMLGNSGRRGLPSV